MKVILLLLIAGSVFISVQAQSSDEVSILRIIKEQEVGWNQGRAQTYCLRLKQDGSLTNILGVVYYGHDEVEARMAQIFGGVFKGSRISKKVQKIRFVSDNVAIVDIDTEVSAFKALPPGIRASAEGKLRTRMQEVMVKENQTWLVAAFHHVDVKTP